MVTIGWIQGDINKWKPFVINRVQQITEIMPAECWRYVTSTENPADAASSGLTASQLRDNSHLTLWLASFIVEDNTKNEIYDTNQEIRKPIQVNCIFKQCNDYYILLYSYSSFNKVVHALAWILR